MMASYLRVWYLIVFDVHLCVGLNFILVNLFVYCPKLSGVSPLAFKCLVIVSELNHQATTTTPSMQFVLVFSGLGSQPKSKKEEMKNRKRNTKWISRDTWNDRFECEWMMMMLMDLTFCLETLSRSSDDWASEKSFTQVDTKRNFRSWSCLRISIFVFFSFVNIFEKDKEHKTIFTELHVVARDFFVRTPRHTVGTDVSTGV